MSGGELALASDGLAIAEENISVSPISFKWCGRHFRWTYGKGDMTRVKNASNVVAQW